MTYKLKRQIVDKIHKCHDSNLLKIIAGMMGIKQTVKLNTDKKEVIKWKLTSHTC